MQLWRITRRPFAATAFSGEGSRLYAARWNPVGVPVVYTAHSLAMAALETFVHLDPSVAPPDLVSIAADVPGDEAQLAQEAEWLRKKLPANWWEPDGAQTRPVGEEWMRSGRSLLLAVPSVVIDGEWNVLVNPLHPDAKKIKVGKPKAFRFDDRMLRR